MRSQPHVTLEDKVAFLRRPDSYPGRVRHVSTIETHFAWLFLTSRHVYKLKKPLRQDVMDYRTLAARERGCRDEVRLNRRLAPSVYLSVVPLTMQQDRLVLGPGGTVEDWLVLMRRLPASQMLDQVLAKRTLSTEELRKIIAMLARFYRRAEPAPMTPQAYMSRLLKQINDNEQALQAVEVADGPGRVEPVMTLQREILEQAGDALASRGASVVEGHGDLRAEHVCIGSPLCVIDCLEFSRELRLLDPLEEIAFLALEIERLRRPELARDLVRGFLTERDDPVAEAIVHFYQSHRATTRAKLAAWHLKDPQFPDPEPWITRACSYLQDAERHASEALRLLRSGGSVRALGWPALEQGRKRHAVDYASHRFTE